MSNGQAAGVFRNVVVLALEGCGVGALPDADAYRDRGANTLGHVATYVGGVDVPLLQWMGLGNCVSARGIDPAAPPAASFGLLGRETEGTDPTFALREMFGGTLEALAGGGLDVIAVGRAAELLGAEQATVHHPASGAREIMEAVVDAVSLPAQGVIVAMVGADSGGDIGARGPVSLWRMLKSVDVHLGSLLDVLTAETLLVVTSTGGADTTLPAKRGPTREYSPLLAYTPAVPSGVELGMRSSLADVAATIAENFGIGGLERGQSFLGPLFG